MFSKDVSLSPEECKMRGKGRIKKYMGGISKPGQNCMDLVCSFSK